MEPVNFVKELEYLLYFINDNLTNGIPGREFATEQLGVLQIATEDIRFEEINPECIGIGGQEKRCFTRLPRSPQKESLGSGCRKLQCPFEHVIQNIMII